MEFMPSDHEIPSREAREAARLVELRRYHILDTPAEPVFDDLTRLAAQVCGTPIAVISFMDRDRQWFKSRHGMEDYEYPRDNTFCAQVICEDDLFIVRDSALDERFTASPAVVGREQARFYAGVPLRVPSGHALGALSVLDRRPRTLKPSQQEGLRALARQVVTQLELRRSIAELERAATERAQVETALRKSEDRFHEFMNNCPAIAYIKDESGRFIYVNQQLELRFEIAPDAWIGKTDAELFSSEMARAVVENDLSVLNDEQTREIEEVIPTPDGKSRYWSSHKFVLRDRDGQRQIGGLSFDITERKRAEHERERLLSELQQALAAVKTLKGLIPICASCKNIRDDEGYWKQIEFYLCEHSELEFTHGICPACLERLYPDFVAAQREAAAAGSGER